MGFCPFFSHQVPFPCPEDISCKLWDGDCVFNRIATGGGAEMKVSTGSYDGDNGQGRQITTGFKCSLVFVYRGGYSSVSQVIVFPNIAAEIADGSNAEDDIHLHASDGFVVNNLSSTYLNAIGYPYHYWAISE